MENERGPQAGSAEAEGLGIWAGLERLVLASASPRRAEILRSVGWPFEAEASSVDETMLAGEGAEEYVERLARAKASAVAGTRLFGLVLGADTTVVAPGGEVLGKPQTDAEARRMLRRLSGRWHEVLTGVALVRAESSRSASAVERTRVRFGALTDAEIDWYVSTGEPADKAGAYAVQGRAALFVEAVEGDYWNVVGLPVRLVYKLVRQFENEQK